MPPRAQAERHRSADLSLTRSRRATCALEAGIPVKVVSDMLGHSSTTGMLDLYATVTDLARHQAADAIARCFVH